MFKNLHGNVGSIVRLCHAQHAKRQAEDSIRLEARNLRDAGSRLAEHVCETIVERAKKIMKSLAEDEPPTTTRANSSIYPEELFLLFGAAQGSPHEPDMPCDVRENQIEEELTRWRADQTVLRGDSKGDPETILEYWKRQAESNNYKFLPMLARVVFALPSSSAQIERDFGATTSAIKAEVGLSNNALQADENTLDLLDARDRFWIDLDITELLVQLDSVGGVE
ncbi:hypothetical protein ATCC90586_006156 [Pythium insidiosum]|nr:hypothetical protein ATCC90586_006156 [Pythium insidiosum]